MTGAAEAAAPLVSVIVVSWNTRELLRACLDSIYAQPPDGPFDVWVVDNASADGSPAMVRERFPQAHLIENATNRGFAAANNLGLRQSRGRYALLLNSDAEATPGALTAMARFMDEHPRAGAAGPKLLNPDGSFQASYARFPTLLSELALLTGTARWWQGPYAPSPRPQASEQARPVDWVAGAALIVRRAAMDEVGLMDERYFLYSEETDWCWRLGRGGWPVWYLPRVEIVHHAGASSQQRSVQTYALLYEGKLRFFAQHYGPWAAGGLRLGLLTLGGLRLLAWLVLQGLPARTDRPRWQRRAEQERALVRACLVPLR